MIFGLTAQFKRPYIHGTAPLLEHHTVSLDAVETSETAIQGLSRTRCPYLSFVFVRHFLSAQFLNTLHGSTTMNFSLKLAGTLLVTALGTYAGSAAALTIDNGIPADTLGSFDIDITTGGESRNANLTVERLATGDSITTDVLFDYFSYVDIGSGGFRLSGSSPVSSGANSVSSNGSFFGASNNNINWNVVSSLPAGESIMTNTFTFTAETGELGPLSLFQYLDEDLDSVSDDIFFTRGSAASADLELFTVDNDEVYGVSHSGAFNESQGLVNASFEGFAADRFNTMKPNISAGTQAVSPTGVINQLPPTVNPIVGASFGPRDIVSVLTWNADADATTATIVTTLGGVPSAAAITPEDPVVVPPVAPPITPPVVTPEPPASVPEPGVMFGLGLLVAAGAVQASKRKLASA